MALPDLRAYIARLEEEGEVQRIQKEVDWNLEVGAIIRRSYDLKAPAPFFQRIRGYPAGYTILGAPIGLSNKAGHRYCRLAVSLGMRADSLLEQIVEEYIKRKKNPLKPVLVSRGPCKENLHLGDEVDLEEFPAPFLHHGDGGRYIGTWHLVATKDPDSGWVNWGMYRLMLHDKNTMGISLSPFQHIGLHYYMKYEPRNRPMEFAVVMGTEPVSPLMAALFFPAGVNEVDVAGAVRGEPVELVKCETVDLEVPATAEIVLEGEIWPHERRQEGPFGEYTGYRSGERAGPVCRVKAITHRDNPILPASCPGVPSDDTACTRALRSGELLDELRGRGLPIKMVNLPVEAPHLCIISSKVPYAGYPKHLASAAWGAHGGRSAYFLVIVEEDVDVTDLDEVWWALTTRCHPDRGIFKLTNSSGLPGLPFLSPQERRNQMAAHVLFDCTWPTDWPPEAIPVKSSFDVLWPQEIQQRVLNNWREFGYE